jgi:predicted glutamine amidotransferase
MCGIVAASAKKGHTFDRKVMNILFLLNEHRGEDSWGFYNNNSQIPFPSRVQKKVGKISGVLNTNKYRETDLFFGHVRKKSKGVVSENNAHPFVYGDVIGCHNGTVHNYDLLRREYDLGTDKEINVDSKVFFKYFSEKDDYKVIEEANGAANLVWVDNRDPDILFVFKHKDRPLFRGVIGKEDERVLYISSTKEALQTVDATNIVEFKDSCLYRIKEGIVEGMPKKFKPNIRLKLSKERQLELYPPKQVPTVNVVKDFKNSVDIKNIGSDTVILPTPCEKGGGRLTLKDGTVWITKKYEDGTEYRFLEDYKSPIEIYKEETLFCKERKMWIRTLYMTDGGFKEVRLGLPTFHFDSKSGEQLRELGKDYRSVKNNDNDCSISVDDYCEFLVDLGTLIEDPINKIREKIKSGDFKALSTDIEKLDNAREELLSEIGQILDNKMEAYEK